MVKLAVAVPASVVSDTPHLREKTSKIGLIGRATAIFGVNEVVVYSDNPKANQNRDLDLVATLLLYMETPQYLRKRLFKIDPRLKYAGILPPLRTPHHPLNSKTANLMVGEYREGVVLPGPKEGLFVDIGVEQPALLREKHYAVGKRLTVQVIKTGRQSEVQTVNGEVPDYWGYKVSVQSSLKKLVDQKNFDFVIGTSIRGTKWADAVEGVAEKWKQAASALIAFGAPARGLSEIAKDENWNLDEEIDFLVNTIPNQGTKTVRTEEAILASLSIMNIQLGFNA